MDSVRRCELPQTAFLRACRDRGAYADCYAVEVPGSVTQAAFVEAFYTTTLFKVERALLGWLAARPSTDGEARRLAQGSLGSFAAWRVEARSADQLLLADFTGRTKSWLMTASVAGADGDSRTRLHFGSAVVPRLHPGTGRRGMGFAFHALLGFHRLYSRLLLASARSRLLARRGADVSEP